MLEKKVFTEINAHTPIETMTMDSSPSVVPSHARGRSGWLRKMFKWKRSVSWTAYPSDVLVV